MPHASHYFFRRALQLTCASLVLLASVLLLGTSRVQAAPTASSTSGIKGLYISPIRQFINQSAGTSKQSDVIVANYTNEPMVVSFSVKAFSVNDFSYNFQFDTAPDNRISFSTTQLELQPNQRQDIQYTISLPADSPPGGQYYTLFATGSGQNGKAIQQIQTTSLLYLTVNGKLTYTSSLVDSHISHIGFRSTVPFSLDIANRGNIHYFAFVSAKLHGWLGADKTSSETHLLLPKTTRRFDSSVPAPRLPGLYRVTYGYNTDYQPAVTRMSWFIYIPPWSLAIVALLVWIIWVRRRRSRRPQTTIAPTAEADSDD